MKSFGKALRIYGEEMYNFILGELTDYEEKIGDFNMVTGKKFLNRIVSFAMKISTLPDLLRRYQYCKNDKALIVSINEAINYQIYVIGKFYNPRSKLQPLWVNESDSGVINEAKICAEIDKFMNSLENKISDRYKKYLVNFKCNEKRYKQLEEVNEFLQKVIIANFAVRALKTGVVHKKDMEKFVRENIFWKGRENEFASVIKSAV